MNNEMPYIVSELNITEHQDNVIHYKEEYLTNIYNVYGGYSPNNGIENSLGFTIGISNYGRVFQKLSDNKWRLSLSSFSCNSMIYITKGFQSTLNTIFSPQKDDYIMDKYPFIKPTKPEPNIKPRDYINRIDILLNNFKKISPENIIKGTPKPFVFFKIKKEINFYKLCLYCTVFAVNGALIGYILGN
tara:strand:- start:1491 stop:2054 length:564 start_codon:yes stop_codon:yes gene_type:complete